VRQLKQRDIHRVSRPQRDSNLGLADMTAVRDPSHYITAAPCIRI
jgi:hypothetical protein